MVLNLEPVNPELLNIDFLNLEPLNIKPLNLELLNLTIIENADRNLEKLKKQKMRIELERNSDR